jgi:protein required for attachment to host cells
MIPGTVPAGVFAIADAWIRPGWISELLGKGKTGMHDVNAFYVVADGGRARFVQPVEGRHFRTTRQFESEHVHDRSHDMGNAPLSRVQESASPTRHGIEPREDPHDRSERDFARHIGQVLNNHPEVSSCEALVLVAPSPILAGIQSALSRNLQDKVVTTLAKDLTKIPDAELPKHLPLPSPLWRKP